MQTYSATHDYKSILEKPRTIAIVGLSPRPSRTSHRIAKYLLGEGFTIVPVNPFHDEILDAKSYPSVAAIPADLTIDIVDIFRQPKHTAGVVREVIERIKAGSSKPVVWTQIGVSSSEAAELAQAEDIEYIANRCILVEHQRLT